MPKTAKNDNLQKARKEKNDEFYTQLADIEDECKHYTEYFRGKTLLCNCDDPRVSNFFYYFYSRFCGLGLKKLIAVCYKNLNPNLFSQHTDEKAVYCIYEGKDRQDDVIDGHEFIKRNEWGVLKGDGDFRSKECIELLKQADVVVTNPPFSLFREYVAQLIEYDKKFLIIGNMNAITYKEIFPLIQNNKMWVGINNGAKTYAVPEGYEGTFLDKSGKRLKQMGNTMWFTNLDHRWRHEEIILGRHYNPKDYPKYDNYDAIEVEKTQHIPMDYEGVMGVPVSFLDKYNPDQFEIAGNLGCYAPDGYSLVSAIYVNKQKIFKRIAIRSRHAFSLQPIQQ
ncbi:MAG: adenine-specific methyltransferase EcoRI family protein [Planctomycetaceae bacterium]|nr:adenine-specific methyltransferase EcoRI family protein [Planctomycetaceae bacterium]